MSFGWGSAIGGALGAAGAFFAAKENRNSAKEQMDFQQRMSNTAFQRQMKDLRKAELNPILAAKLGGASTPQGAGYQTPNIGLAATQGAHQANSAKQVAAQAQLTQNEAVKSGAEAKLYSEEPWVVAGEKLNGMGPIGMAALKAYWENFIKNDAKSPIGDALKGALDSAPPGKDEKKNTSKPQIPLEIEINRDRNGPVR